MLKLIFLSFISICSLTAATTERSCFSDHLREAKALNLTRAPLYSDLSGGESESISRQLIFGENLVIFFWAPWIDARAAKYQQEGINIVCDEFVSMKKAPAQPFALEKNPPKLETYVKPRLEALQSQIRTALAVQDFSLISQLLSAKLRELETERAFNCMTRHVLESMLRISNLAPRQALRAQLKNLPSTSHLSASLIEGHLLGLLPSRRLDMQAAPVQAMGVPIICKDVPPISASPL